MLPVLWRALAVAALLVTALAPAASLAAEVLGSAPAAGCDAQSMLPDPAPVAATDTACVAPDLERDQAYLVETARPGRTMLRQGPALAVERVHPMFVRRLAEAIGEARAAGLPSAGIFSAYRPPAFGVGSFSDKFNSLHTYGLAVDMKGIGGPGSSEAKLWYEIAARHQIVCPYGAGNRREWNHCQPTPVKSIVAGNPLRGTVSPPGPIDLEAMFAMGEALVNASDADEGSPELQPASDDKFAAASLANAYPHEAHGQPKHRIISENASAKSAPVKKYRIASLTRRESSVTEHEHAHPKRSEHGNARLDRAIKGICRGC